MANDQLPIKEFPAGHQLIREGRFGREMYILIKGEVEVSIQGIEVTKIDAKGSFIGEICALIGTQRIATITTTEPSKFYVIDDLSKYFSENPSSGFMMAKTLASRLIDMNQAFVKLKKELLELKAKSHIDEEDRNKLQAAIHNIQDTLLKDAMPCSES